MVKAISSYQETSTQFADENTEETAAMVDYKKKFVSNNAGWGRIWTYYRPKLMSFVMVLV